MRQRKCGKKFRKLERIRFLQKEQKPNDNEQREEEP